MTDETFINKLTAYFAAAVANHEGISKDAAHAKIDGIFAAERNDNHPCELCVVGVNAFRERIWAGEHSVYATPKNLAWLTDAISESRFVSLQRSNWKGTPKWSFDAHGHSIDWEKFQLFYGEWDVY